MKEVHGRLYVHWSGLDVIYSKAQIAIDDALRILKESGKELPGPIFDIVKFERNLESISFLWYENFDTVAHPALYLSAKVNRATGKITISKYKKNRPILHRKDSMVGFTYTHYKKFYSLTRHEEAHGLLNRSDIGREDQWNALLKKKKLKIVGHSIRKL
jgi:DNA phosphorothioation-associated putative methyltransferase